MPAPHPLVSLHACGEPEVVEKYGEHWARYAREAEDMLVEAAVAAESRKAAAASLDMSESNFHNLVTRWGLRARIEAREAEVRAGQKHS